MKKKKDKFDVVAAVKNNARDRVGQPKASEIIVPKRDRPARHKKNWLKNIDTEEE